METVVTVGTEDSDERDISRHVIIRGEERNDDGGEREPEKEKRKRRYTGDFGSGSN